MAINSSYALKVLWQLHSKHGTSWWYVMSGERQSPEQHIPPGTAQSQILNRDERLTSQAAERKPRNDSNTLLLYHLIEHPKRTTSTEIAAQLTRETAIEPGSELNIRGSNQTRRPYPARTSKLLTRTLRKDPDPPPPIARFADRNANLREEMRDAGLSS
jgi:hypothetical protein